MEAVRSSRGLGVSARRRLAGCVGVAAMAWIAFPVTGSAAGAAASVTLSASPSSPSYGQNITLTASVTGTTAGGPPRGTVSFSLGSNMFATAVLATSGTYSSDGVAATKGLAPGTHAITASYSGDANYSQTSTTASVSVGSAPTATTAGSSPNPSIEGGSVSLNAKVVAAQQGPVALAGSVAFSIDGGLISDVPLNAGGYASAAVSTLKPGSHSIVAQYRGTSYYMASDSPPITQVVKAPPAVSPAPTPIPAPVVTAVPQAPAAAITAAPGPADGSAYTAPPATSSNAATPADGSAATPGGPAAASAQAPSPSVASYQGGSFIPTTETQALPILGSATLAAARGAAVDPKILDTAASPAIEFIGAFSGLNFGRALTIWPLLLPVNVLAYFIIWRAVRRGRMLTAAALGGGDRARSPDVV